MTKKITVNTAVKHEDLNSYLLLIVMTFFLSALISDTHVVIVSCWYHDVHLGAFGTDDVTAEGVLTQIDLAALGFVDGHGGNCTQHLQ